MDKGFVNRRLRVQLASVALDPNSCGDNGCSKGGGGVGDPNDCQTNVGFFKDSEGVYVGSYVGTIADPQPLVPMGGFQFINPATEEGWVYFLLDGGNRVLYVGQADDLIARLCRHPHHGLYRRAGYVRAPLSRLDGVEAVLIAALNPPLNSHRPPYDIFDVQYVVDRYFGGRVKSLPNHKTVRGAAVARVPRSSRKRKVTRYRRPSSKRTPKGKGGSRA